MLQVYVGWGGEADHQPVLNPFNATVLLRAAARKDIAVTMSTAPGVPAGSAVARASR